MTTVRARVVGGGRPWFTRFTWSHCGLVPAQPPVLSVYRLNAEDHNVTVDLLLFHDLLLRSYLYHCVWSVITAHNLTPEKRDNNYSPHPLTPTSCLRNNIQLKTGIFPCCGCL